MSLNSQKFTAAELRPSVLYFVISDFTDYDGVIHQAGERWRFLAKNFLPYEDGLTLQIEQDGQPLAIRLQWRDESQGTVIENFSDYVEEVADECEHRI